MQSVNHFLLCVAMWLDDNDSSSDDKDYDSTVSDEWKQVRDCGDHTDAILSALINRRSL